MLARQGFGSRRGSGVISLKSCQKLTSWSMSDGSKMDPQLTKAEPICSAGSTSVTTYLRREIIAAQQQLGEEQEHVREVILQTPRSVKKDGKEKLQSCQSRDSPACSGAALGEAAVPLQTVEVHTRADIHLQTGENCTLEQGDVTKGSCDPVGNPF